MMAKQAELNNMISKGSGQREIRPVWNNVQRVNHQNQFVPKAVLTRTGKIQVNTTRTNGTNTVNTVRTSGTNTVNTARHNFNRQAKPTNAARKVNTIKPIVNNARQKAVSVVGGKRETAVKPSVGYNWRHKRHYWKKVSKYNGGSSSRNCVPFKDPLGRPSPKGLGDIQAHDWKQAMLAKYHDFNGGLLLLEE
ncbi:hypothetical protein Tco_0282815 [Tanacetum coccineum]